MATAIRSVVTEAIEAANNPLLEEMSCMEGRLHKRMDGLDQRMDGLESRMDGLENRMDGFDKRMDGFESQLRTTNENFQLQLAQHRKDVAADLREALSAREVP